MTAPAAEMADDLKARGVEGELAAMLARNLERTRCRYARWSAVFSNTTMGPGEVVEWLRERGLWRPSIG